MRRLCLALALCLAQWACAQEYPWKPIRMIVPFPAGGPADIFARPLAHSMSVDLGQPVVIENIGGVGGVLGIDRVAKSEPDGYTIGVNSASTLSIAPYSLARIPYDANKDFALITLVARVPEVVAVHPSLPVSTLAELVAYARAHPGKVNFGSSGGGSITHLAVELLKAAAGIDLMHVPYQGAAPAVTDLIGGQVHMAIFDVPVLIGHIRNNRLKALAVTSAARVSMLPGVPTTAEAGYFTVTSDNWYGMVMAAATPPEIQRRVHGAAVRALRSQAVTDQFSRVGGLASPGTPQEYAELIASEQAKWRGIVNAIGFKEPN